jgi:4-hydroxybenzoate polyprenyltransferase
VSALAVFGLATYTPFKRRWWAGPLWNSWIVALLPLIAWLCGSAHHTVLEGLGDGQVRAAMASVFASYGCFVVLGYLKDVEADRVTGYMTLPVRFGRLAAVAVSAGFCAVSVVASLMLIPFTETLHPAGLPQWVGGLVALAAAHLVALRVQTDEAAWPAVVLSVLGFVWLHLGEATLHRPLWAPATVLLSLLAPVALWLRPVRSQV